MTVRPKPDRPIHDRAAILSIGDELTRGQMLDTNSKELSALLLDLGIATVAHVTVPDDRAAISRVLRELCERSPLVIITGGLGPTADDLTRDALADVLGEPLVEDPGALADLESLLRARNRPMTPAQRTQALRPPSAQCLRNERGTAPGLLVSVTLPVPDETRSHESSSVFCLPGPPGEWRPMFERDVRSHLRPVPGRVVRTRLIRVIGLSEAHAATMVPGLMDRDRRPQVGITASDGVLTWRICADLIGDAATAEAQLDATAGLIEHAMGDHIIAGQEAPAEALVWRLTQLGRTVTTAESCTGGMIGTQITEVPGSSAVFKSGFITYSNQAKSRDLGVREATLQQHGPVSAECVREMAQGAARRANADYALSVSGVAGPDGGTINTPVGTVWLGLTVSTPGDGKYQTVARHLIIPGDRTDIRRRATQAAIGLLLLHLAAEAAGEQCPAEGRLKRVALPWQTAER